MPLFGESPREAAAREQLSFLKGLLPQFQQPTFDLQATWREVLQGLNKSTAFATSSLSQALGHQLSGAGVAAGQPRSEAYISALAPMYGEAAKTKAMTFADLSKFSAQNVEETRKLLLALTGQEGNIIELMRSSTGLGNILGLLQFGTNVLSPILTVPGVWDWLFGGKKPAGATTQKVYPTGPEFGEK